MAAGGFVIRAFEAILKQCGRRKYPQLREAIRIFFAHMKVASHQTSSTEANQEASSVTQGSLQETEGVPAESGEERNEARTIQRSADAATDKGGQMELHETLAALANSGHTLTKTQADFVLNPLRLSFETKNWKILELALDSLHKLIAYDHLEGDVGLNEGVALFADIVIMVCSSIDGFSYDSTIVQALKLLLTAVASTKFRVHREPLLEIISVCYKIALNSKSPVSQATSKAILTQVVSIIFKRLETDQEDEACISSGSSRQAEVTTAEIKNSKVEETSSDVQANKEMSIGDAHHQAKEGALVSAEHLYYLANRADIKGLEAALEKAVYLGSGRKIAREFDLESMSMGEHDAFLVFRSICQMSMKDGDDEVSNKTKILSLELLQGLLEGVSDPFTKNFHFNDSVKAYLSYALLRASVSDSHIIFKYAAKIFPILILQHREVLKGEICIFLPLICLRFLDGTDFIYKRLTILWMLEEVCKDSQMLVDMYVNYDCDLQMTNLFQCMVTSISRIVQRTSDTDTFPASHTYSTKSIALQCLINLLKSLTRWEKLHRTSEKQEVITGSFKEEVTEKYSTEIKREDGPPSSEKAEPGESTVEAAISEFNKQPVKGVEYLMSNKLVEETPASVAHFIKTTPSLDKDAVGDYLGLHEEFPLAVMHAYVGSLNFSGMKFDSAIREFLEGFSLPGEAEKIDRILEKFAERYHADNPGHFKAADTAYALAYAVILLNVDAHNPSVNPKMSKSDFIRVNAVNDTELCAPTEILEEIFDSVVKEEIKMNDLAIRTGKNSSQKADGEEIDRLLNILNLSLPRRKSLADNKSENEAIIKQIQVALTNQGRRIYYVCQQNEIMRPMVEVVGWPLLAAFSITMDEGDAKERIKLCMEGFTAGIHITHILGMDTMRYAYLTSLVRFTFLHAPKELRSRNVEALRTLLALSNSEPDSIQNAWNAVLECISRLEFIISSPSITATVMHGMQQTSRDAVLQSLQELVGEPSVRIFANTTYMCSEAIIEFFTALCGVSMEELKQSPARVFSLQKLVEISYNNIGRVHVIWSRIWSVLANHLIFAVNHDDAKITTYAMDSLRQLCLKYLERVELTDFTFQNEILKPFVVLMHNGQNEFIRCLTIDCAAKIIKLKVGSMRSGWRTFFEIFIVAADDKLESVVESGFENLEQVILEHLDQVGETCFIDCVNCLFKFAANKRSQHISLKAIALLRICEDRVAQGAALGIASSPVNVNEDTTRDTIERYWSPLLVGLQELTLDPRHAISKCALEVLFDMLNERGSTFSISFWENIFSRILFPIFEHVRLTMKESSNSIGDEELRETNIHSLKLLCNLFNSSYKAVGFMLPPLLDLLFDCAKKTDQTVVSISLSALMHLIEVGGTQFSESDWDSLLKSIRDAAYTTQPRELFNDLELENCASFSSDIEVNLVDIASTAFVDEGETLPGIRDIVADHVIRKEPKISNFPVQNQLSGLQIKLKGSEGGEAPRRAPDGGFLQRSQTIGQRILENMMDNAFVRKALSRSKSQASESSAPPSLLKVPKAVEPDSIEKENPWMKTMRTKCVTQLLLIRTVDSIQKKCWSKLTTPQKITVLETLLSLLEFAASFNSEKHLRMRMRHCPYGRPPLNILRQEVAATCIYMDILQKATSGKSCDDKHSDSRVSTGIDVASVNKDSSVTEHPGAHEKLERLAEEKLVSFCEMVLKEVSDIENNAGESTSLDVHRVMELRSRITVKVLKGMCFMNHEVFRRHLKEFYPLIAKLVFCNRMDVRKALSDLFRIQLKLLLP